MVKVVKIKADGLSAGPYEGVLATATPALSWSFEGDERNWVQKSYEIAITSGDKRHHFGPVQSSDCAKVSWPAEPLVSKQRFSVSVKVSGDSESEWSESFEFQAGVFDWDTQFIALKDQEVVSHASKKAPETLFRSPVVHVHKPVKRATVYSTALGIYEVEINGTKISQDHLAPGWTSYSHRLLHQVYDVTDQLRETTVIGARVASGWYSGFLGFRGGNSNIYGHHRAISLELDIVYADGTQECFRTDETWKSSLGPIVSAQLYDGEDYDANLEVPSAWKDVEIVDYPASNVAPQAFPYVTVVDTLQPVEKITSKSGKTIFDFGQNSVGVVKIKTKAPKGHTITLRHAEVLEQGELGTRPLRNAKATDTYTFKGDENGEEYTPRFTFHGFRYLQVDNWPGTPRLADFELQVWSTKMEQTGTFTCSEPRVQQLYKNIFHSTRGNFVSIPSDCPQRDERMGWLGDIALFAPTALYLFDAYPFLRSWLEDLKLEQAGRGFPSVVVPDIIHAFETQWNGIYAAIWQDAAVIVPYRLFEATSNPDILAAQYESAKTWYEFVPKLEGKIRWDTIKFQLGDWLDPTAPPENPAKAMTDPYLVADAFLYLIVSQLQKIAEILGKDGDAAKYRRQAQQCKADFRKEYVTGSGRVVSDSQTAYALAITFGLLTENEVSYAGSRLAELVQKNDYKIGTGFAGTPYVTEALTVSGHLEDAYKMLLQDACPSWLYPVSVGATTVWERWDSMLPNGDINPGEMTSFNHYALGAVATWLYERVAGIRLLEPGWKSISFKPMPGGGISEASASHRSPFGLVSSSWKVVGETFKYEIVVPLNTKGVVELPDGQVKEVGSGTYSFEVKM